MKALIFLLAALPLAAQLSIPLMSKRPGLNRSGMVAGVNVTGGVDTQSIASIPPGTATLTRGANSGTSTDDPTVSLAGWTFDSGDRVSGLPAKGAAWTTTNCSGVECYTITSAGTEYINGEARRNVSRLSEDYVQWAGYAAGFNSITATTATPSGRPAFVFNNKAVGGPGPTIPIGSQNVNQIMSLEFKPGTCTGDLRIGYVSADTALLQINVATGAKVSGVGTSTAITGGYFRLEIASLWPGSLNRGFYFVGTPVEGCTYTMSAMNFNLGTTALAYQKTTDSREWALETVGNYVGLLTWWGRWDRVLGPGEVYRNYMQYLKPRLNASGNTLP